MSWSSVMSYRGPEQWGQLNPKWETCETGSHQSPIDLRDGKVEVLSQLGKLNRTYKPAPAVIRNRGHDIMVQWTGDAGGIIINGTEYKLKQCHWHTPAEHRVRGQSFYHEIRTRLVKKNDLGVVNPRISSLEAESILDISVLSQFRHAQRALFGPCSRR
ncbi:hypothetical protein DH2020_038953 [Rehmannia glutinosa]|uniref:Alpha-carbonic anhydrase domain-containing protein n=1 Tax=Rehmannia glutinosa TaxID=99300 RepID=A0ABR0UZA7_REHGL